MHHTGAAKIGVAWVFLSLILLGGYFFHPFNGFAIELFLNCEVRHRSRSRCAMPMLFARRKPNHVARVNFFDWTAPALGPTTAGCHNKRLP